jgi:hypothetical protein
MKTRKSTPLQVLQKQKARLQARSQALRELLESDLDLAQHHFGAILSQTLASKVAPLPLLLKTAKQYLLPLLFLRMQSRRKERKNSDPASKKKASNKKTAPPSKK